MTHLAELLRAAQPQAHGVERVVVWGRRRTLEGLPDQPWLDRIHQPMLDGSVFHRLYWQNVKLPPLAKNACDILFVPGGAYSGNFKPFITMSRNLLPFEPAEMRRYAPSWIFIRLALLRLSQSRTFRRADGMIFLTTYSRGAVMKTARQINGASAIIPHGVEERFRLPPRAQKPITAYSEDEPFKLLYVSIVDLYKHQWVVAEVVARLRQRGLPIQLDLVGSAYGPALRRLQSVTARVDAHGNHIRYQGQVPFSELHSCYHQADAFVFASSCENMPNILLEAMAAGLPIACSNRGPMPEILGEGGVYFDPEDACNIATALYELVTDPQRRAECAAAAYERARQYSWERCADETFSFLAEVYRQSVA